MSLPYFASIDEIEYTTNALHAVADHAWRLLPMYRMDAKTGEWRHVSRARSFPERRWLAHMKFPRHEIGNEGNEGNEVDVDVDEVPSEEAIRLGLETQLTDGLRVLELCGQVSNASNA